MAGLACEAGQNQEDAFCNSPLDMSHNDMLSVGPEKSTEK